MVVKDTISVNAMPTESPTMVSLLVDDVSEHEKSVCIRILIEKAILKLLSIFA